MRAFAILAMLFWSASANSYSNFVHKLVCSAAYDLSAPATQEFIDDLMAASNVDRDADFPEGCVWADDVRKTTHQETYEYHYINVPAAETIDLSRDCAAHDCVTTAIERYALNLNDPNVKTRNRKEALLFLGHFVADIHQPLHVGNAEDLGGNTIEVFTSETDQTANTKLHAVWDGGIPTKARLGRLDSKQTLLDKIAEENRDDWRTNDVDAWANESFMIARSLAYQLPNGELVQDGTRLTVDYYDQAKPVVYEQAMKAAVRLAFLMDMAVAGELTHSFFE